jgi:hypothetical protein
MFLALPRPTRLPAGLSGLLLAVAALVMQLAAASVVPFAAPTIDRLVAVSICHGDGGATGSSDRPAHHHAPDCAVCPLCQAIAHAGVLLAAPTLAFAAPVALIAHAFVLPPARAPPGRAASAASARGPPATL